MFNLAEGQRYNIENTHWMRKYIYIYIYIEREREREIRDAYWHSKLLFFGTYQKENPILPSREYLHRIVGWGRLILLVERDIRRAGICSSGPCCTKSCWSLESLSPHMIISTLFERIPILSSSWRYHPNKHQSFSILTHKLNRTGLGLINNNII